MPALMAEHAKSVALSATTDVGLLEKTRPLVDPDKHDDYNHTSRIHEDQTDRLKAETDRITSCHRTSHIRLSPKYAPAKCVQNSNDCNTAIHAPYPTKRLPENHPQDLRQMQIAQDVQ